jgi:hypothetical protein
MILESLFFTRYINCNNELTPSESSTIEDIANMMIFLLSLIIYIFIIFVAVYTSYRCNKKNTFWLIINTFVAAFFPTLYLIVHPNLVLAHEGPKSYCETY